MLYTSTSIMWVHESFAQVVVTRLECSTWSLLCSIQVDVVCTSRIPEFFIITLMTSTGRVFNETRQHQPGQAVANFTISLPPSVDVCSLHVTISAGNSAGMSAPSETVEVGKLHNNYMELKVKNQYFPLHRLFRWQHRFYYPCLCYYCSYCY